MPKIINRNPRNPLTGFMDEKNKKPLIERKGDWSCPKCRNLNFAFRTKCNRCNISKSVSDSLHDNFMKNVLFIINQNEKKRNDAKEQ